jgi:hypothetical protein
MTRRVRQQLAHRHRAPRRGQGRQYFTNPLVERKLALFRQPHDRGRGEGLRDGCDLENRVVRGGHVKLYVRQAVRLLLDNLPFAHDGHGDCREASLPHFRTEVIVYVIGPRMGGDAE